MTWWKPGKSDPLPASVRIIQLEVGPDEHWYIIEIHNGFQYTSVGPFYQDLASAEHAAMKVRLAKAGGATVVTEIP